MRRALICACTAVAALSLMSGAPAQITAPDMLAPEAPAQPEYFNGAGAADPAVERDLSVAPRYRSFLPAAVDLSGTMPPTAITHPSCLLSVRYKRHTAARSCP